MVRDIRGHINFLVEEIYIAISIFFLASVCLITLFVWPTFQDIEKESFNLVSQKTALAVAKDQYSDTKAFEKKYNGYKPDLDKVDALFIDSQNPVAFIKFIESSASMLDVSLEISSPSFSKDNSFSYEKLLLSVLGEFSDIIKFAKYLESAPYLIKIENISIKNNKNEKGLSLGKISSEISIIVYSN